MIAARLAGIDVFATGGIGGVHPGGEDSLDISADLEELARTPLVVVCAGPKSILDVGRTLEVLETRGVPVVGWQSDEVAGFLSHTSGHRAPLRVESAAEVATLVARQRALGLSAAILVAVPLPTELALPRRRGGRRGRARHRRRDGRGDPRPGEHTVDPRTGRGADGRPLGGREPRAHRA